MADINVDELGPVDYLVVAFPADEANFSDEMAAELKALIESKTVRVLDLVVLIKDEDGSVEASELRDADDSAVGELRALESDLAVLLAEEESPRSANRSSPAARLPCWYGKTHGRRRSARPCAGPEGSWSPAAGSRPKRSSPRSRRIAKPP
jgi:hypothetical protein